MKGIKLGDKESKYPIIQGGMGVGVSLHRLAGNVSKEGGIGIISTADIGYQEEDFANNPNEANLRAIGKEIKKAREIAGEDKILGVNVMVALKNYADIVKECVKQFARICKRNKYQHCTNSIFFKMLSVNCKTLDDKIWLCT